MKEGISCISSIRIINVVNSGKRIYKMERQPQGSRKQFSVINYIFSCAK
jgi:hypothetical protein